MSEEINLNQIEELAALPADVASGFAYASAKNGELVLGEAKTFNNSRVELGPGSEYRLPKGYYLENNVIVTASAASSTSATATADDIMLGKTAWVNGVKITGTARGFANLAQSTATSGDILKTKTAYNSNGDQLVGTIETRVNGYTIDIDSYSNYDSYNHYTQDIMFSGPRKRIEFKPGYYPSLSLRVPDLSETTAGPGDVLKGKFTVYRIDNSSFSVPVYKFGEGTLDLNQKIKEEVKANTTLTAEDLLANKKGYDRDGNVVTGTMQNVTNTSTIVLGDSNNSYTIPKGFHDGTGKVIYNPVSTVQTTATGNDILYGKTALTSDGTLITGTIDNGEDMVIDATSVAPYDVSHKYFRSLHITDSALDSIHRTTSVPEEMVPEGKRYVDVSGIVKTGTMPIIPPTRIKINGKNGLYKIPKGYHNGTGKIVIQLEKDISNGDEYNDVSSDNVPANVAYFDDSGRCIAGEMRLGTYDPIYTYKDWSYQSIEFNTIFSFSDDPTGHRLISFNNRGQTSFMTDMGNLRGSTFESDVESDKVLSQYNVDNFEKGYTVLAIPTELHVWGNLKTIPKRVTNGVRYFGNFMDIFNNIDDNVITEDNRALTFAKLDPMASDWFSKFLLYNRRNNIVIDDITVDFNRSNILLKQRYADEKWKSNIIPNGMDIDHINIPTFRISFPYIPEEYPTEDYLKKCCDNTRVLFDSIDYNTSEDYGNYKIYGVCTPVRQFAYSYHRNEMDDTYYRRFYGGNFAITFHVYNKKKNNYTYERDPGFKDDYVMNQLGFLNTNKNYRLIPIDIRFSGIHMR